MRGKRAFFSTAAAQAVTVRRGRFTCDSFLRSLTPSRREPDASRPDPSAVNDARWPRGAMPPSIDSPKTGH